MVKKIIKEEGQYLEVPVELPKKAKKKQVVIVEDDNDDTLEEEVEVVSHTKAKKLLPNTKDKKPRSEKQNAVLEKLLAANKKRFEVRKAQKEAEAKEEEAKLNNTKKVLVKPKIKYLKKNNFASEGKTENPQRRVFSNMKKVSVSQTTDSSESESEETMVTETDVEPEKPKKKVKARDYIQRLEQKVEKLVAPVKTEEPHDPYGDVLRRLFK